MSKSTTFTLPCYPDTASVMAGLLRVEKDLAELIEEIATLRLNTAPEALPAALEAMYNQFFYLGSEMETMRRAIIKDISAAQAPAPEKSPAQPGPAPFTPVKVDFTPLNAVDQISGLADGLEHLARTLPEEENGLAHLLSLISTETVYYCDMLADALEAAKSDANAA